VHSPRRCEQRRYRPTQHIPHKDVCYRFRYWIVGSIRHQLKACKVMATEECVLAPSAILVRFASSSKLLGNGYSTERSGETQVANSNTKVVRRADGNLLFLWTLAPCAYMTSFWFGSRFGSGLR